MVVLHAVDPQLAVDEQALLHPCDMHKAVGAQVANVGQARVNIVLAPDTSALSSGVRVRKTRRFTESRFEFSIITNQVM